MVASALVCLALTVFKESRGEPHNGQVAVASVVLNRVSNNDSDVCSEVAAPSQFPWASRILRKTQAGYVIARKDIPSGRAWESSVKLAHAVLGGHEAIIPRITSFHNRAVNPRWRLRRMLAVGRHIFYA